MKSNHYVKDIMTKDVITLKLTDSLYHAEMLFKENSIRHIPVLEHNKLVGMLSLSDLKRLGFLDAYSKVPVEDTPLYDMLSVEDIMIKNLTTVDEDDSIFDTCKVLIQKQFHALPVTKKGQLRGIVTTTDLLKYFARYSL